MPDRDWFLKIDDVAGDVTEACYQGWIELLSWHVGMTGGVGGGGGGGRASRVEGIVTVMRSGPWTATLMNASATGAPFKKAVIHVLQDGRVLYRAEFQTVYVSAFRPGGSDDQGRPLVTFELAFGPMRFDDGKPSRPQPRPDYWLLPMHSM